MKDICASENRNKSNLWRELWKTNSTTLDPWCQSGKHSA